MVEHLLAMQEVVGSSPIHRSVGVSSLWQGEGHLAMRDLALGICSRRS